MDKNIVLNLNGKPLAYETMQSFWIKRPYKFHEKTPSNGPHTTGFSLHGEIELNLVVKSTLGVDFGDKQFIAQEGELVVANCYTPHSYTFNGETLIDHLVVETKFLVENGIDPMKLIYEERIDDGYIRKLYADLENHRRNPQYRDAAISGAVLQLMAHLSRHYSKPANEARPGIDLKSFGTDFEYVRMSIDFIGANLQNNPSVDVVSEHVGLSKYHFMRTFKRVTGYTFIEYTNMVKCKHAKNLLLNGETSVTDVALASGFNSVSYFTKVFKSYYGKLPSEYITGKNSI